LTTIANARGAWKDRQPSVVTDSDVGRIRFAGVIVLLLLSGCSKTDQTSASANPAGPTSLPAAPAPDAPPPPPTGEAANWTPSGLDELLAPIALYPEEVLDAGNWLLDHQSLTGDALTQAAREAEFSPSVQALVHFPAVIDMMCRELDWTRQVGDAFVADQGAVLAAVQRLRAQAAEVGNLQSTPQMAVDKTVENEKSVIVIQPANPQVVYVPQYNPTTVYTTPAATTTTATTTTTSSGISTSDAVVGGLLAFGAGVLVGSLINDHDDDYYCYPNWGYGGVYYGPRPYYPHNTFIYAPRYPGYRPTPYYRPPPNYGNRYNRYGNTNVNINNNYFNRFEGNRNRVSTYQPRSPVTQPRPAARPAQPSQTYERANRPTASTRPATRQPAPTGTYQGPRVAQNRPAATTGAPASRPQPGARPQAAARTQPQTYQRSRAGADRGYPQVSGTRSDYSAQNRGARSFNDAGTQQGAMDRAASERGRASMRSAERPSQSAPQRSSRGGGARRS
jgi:hypothetical protein